MSVRRILVAVDLVDSPDQFLAIETRCGMQIDAVAQRVVDAMLAEAMANRKTWKAMKSRFLEQFPELAGHWSVDTLFTNGVVAPVLTAKPGRRK